MYDHSYKPDIPGCYHTASVVPWYSGACGILLEAGGDEPQVPTAPDCRHSQGTLPLTSTSPTRTNDGRPQLLAFTIHPINRHTWMFENDSADGV